MTVEGQSTTEVGPVVGFVGAVANADSSHRAPDDSRAGFVGSFEINEGVRYLVNNQTAYLIRVQHDDPEVGELVLPPFAQRVIKGVRLRPFEHLIRLHRQRHEIFVRRYRGQLSSFENPTWIAWIALLGLAGIAAFDVFTVGSLAQLEFFVAGAVAIVVVAAVLIVSASREHDRRRKAIDEGTEAGDIAFGLGGSYTDGNETARSAEFYLTLALVIIAGAVLPAIAIVVATDTRSFLIFEGGLRVKPNIESRLVSRCIQITYTCVLSLFPALLFFQFDRQRAGSLRSQWVRALFRMDGRMRTLADVHAIYGDALYEASGNSDDSVRSLGGKHSPIVVATILIALGWTVLVVRTESFDFSAVTAASQHVQVAEEQAAIAEEAAENVADANAPPTEEDANVAAATANAAAQAASTANMAAAEVADASTQAPTDGGDDAVDQAVEDSSEQPVELDDIQAATNAAAVQAQQAAQAAGVAASQIQGTSFFQVLAPNPSAAGMAFLGAYFFGIYLLLRSYFRGDLISKLYNQITARLVTVVVIAYLMNAVLFSSNDQQEVLWALAFLAGVVPTTVLATIFKTLSGLVQAVAGDVFAADRPLEHVDGIDIYESSRLESEGIPDVTSLANSDLASVMLRTRLPIGRVIDWADQAALMVVVGAPGPKLDPRIRSLRTHGIRTGTDLLAAAEIDHNTEDLVQCLKHPPHPQNQGLLHRTQNKGQKQDPAVDTSPPTSTSDAKIAASSTSGTSSSTSQAPRRSVRVDDMKISELCEAIRRQPVMSQILQWRSSPLDDVDRRWIELPGMSESPPVSSLYKGPLPSTGQHRTRDRNNTASASATGPNEYRVATSAPKSPD